MVKKMSKKIETGLIVVKDDLYTKIRRSIFSVFFKKENKLLKMMYDIEKPKNKITEKIIVPKEIKRY